MQTEWILIKHLKTNDGQIPGVPKNPRYIRNDRFDLLKQSITDDPEMMQIRELVVYPLDGKYIAICGNMRLKACKALGWTEIPCKVLDTDMPAEKLRALAIKDNNNFGDYDWDMVKADWDLPELESFGIELPDFCVELNGADSDESDGEGEQFYTQKVDIPQYEITGEKPSLESLCRDERASELEHEIENSSLSNAEKQFLLKAAKRHFRFDYGKIAEYYAHAGKEMQELMERSALVIIDYNDAIANGYAKLREEIDLMRSEDSENAEDEDA